MYNYVNFAPGDPFANSNSHGGSGSFTYNASTWIGLTAEAGGYNTERNLFPLTGNNSLVRGGFMSYLFGPRLNLRKFDYLSPLLSSWSAVCVAAARSPALAFRMHLPWPLGAAWTWF